MEAEMAKCEQCGNDYDKTFEVHRNGESHTFDSFECAIEMMAPRCGQCSTRIVGHGLEANGAFYCCDNCAESAGVTGLRDRI
jgi:ssDNA-binding Zn-finger/Zn-ribbon topoisomerase 1